LFLYRKTTIFRVSSIVLELRLKRLLLPVLLLCAAPLWAFLFAPGTRLKVVSTEYFDIIYSDRTEESAFHLAAEADKIYEQVAALLKEEPSLRIPVVISDIEADTNGYTILYPYTKIVLYAVPPEPESSIGNTRDYLLYLFTHELTHAVSLNIRGPVWQFLRPVFGDYFTAPNDTWMMPMYMIEGVTVSFGSLKGYGRLNDPYIRQYLLQAALEDEFLTHPQASGALDRFPFSSSYYFYGGFFSHYLQETYGMESYADLWHETGKGWIIPGLAGAFRRVYGETLKKVWYIFQERFAWRGIPPKEPELLMNEPDYIIDLTGIDEDIYYISAYDKGVHAYNTVTGDDRFLTTLQNPEAASVDVSPDGRQLALGLLEDTEEGTMRITRIYDLEKQSFSGTAVPGMREGAFISGGLAGVLAQDNGTRLAVNRGGKTETLLEGSAGVVFGPLRELKPGVYVFLAHVNGKRDLYMYRDREGKTERIVLPLEGPAYPRGLSVHNGRIFFSFNNDSSLYRLGMINDGRLFIQEDPVSGGVFNPVIRDDRMFYTGLFARGWFLAGSPFAESDLTEAGQIVLEPSDAFSRPGAPKKVPEYEADADRDTYSPARYMAPEFVLPYINSGSVVIDNYGHIEVTGFDVFGLQTYISDPAEGNEISLAGGYAWRNPFADAAVEWNRTVSPVGMSLGLYDHLLYSDDMSDSYRQSSAALGVSMKDTDPVSGVRYGIELAARSDFSAPETTGITIPYNWQYSKQNYSAGFSADAGILLPSRTDLSVYTRGVLSAYGNLGSPLTLTRYFLSSVSAERTFPGYWGITGSTGLLYDTDPLPAVEVNLSAGGGNYHSFYPGFMDYEGFLLNGYTDYRFTDGLWKMEAKVIWAPPEIPLRFRFYGAWSPDDVFTTDGVRTFHCPSRYPVFTEFSNRGPLSTYYTGGDLELGLFNLEVQRKVWVFPLFLNRINMSAGYRAAYNGGPYYHSLFVRLGMTFSPLIGSYSRLHITMRFEGACSLTDGEFSFSLF